MTPLGAAILDQLELRGLDTIERHQLAAQVICEARERAIAGDEAAIRYVCSEWLDAWCGVLGDGVRPGPIREAILAQALEEAWAPSTIEHDVTAERLLGIWTEERHSVSRVARRIGLSWHATRARLRAAGATGARGRGRPRAQEAA